MECHGAEGEGGEVKGVEGLEGFMMKPINSQDEMYTRTDETFFNIITYGQPDLGMTPFGKAFGGELGVGDIEAIVTFMRYTWDDRAELPQEASAAFAAPPLGPDEVPSYEVHIAPMVKRYCVSCHRSRHKENKNYLMETYEEIMTSGDNAPNVIPGDLNSNLYLHGPARGDRGRRSDAAHPGAEAGVRRMLAPLDRGRCAEHCRRCSRGLRSRRTGRPDRCADHHHHSAADDHRDGPGDDNGYDTNAITRASRQYKKPPGRAVF